MEKNKLNVVEPEIPKYNQKKTNKQNIPGIVFTRACCSIGILIFHYFVHSEGNFKIFYKTANSAWGFLFVTAFFNISGSVLYFNYPTLISKKRFYYKRWKSIFPSFYKTYYLVGEWFLGAIIIIYFIYPLLLWFMNKNIFIFNLIIYSGYFLMYKTKIFIISNTNNLITCTYSFYFGMIAIKYRKFFFENKYVFIFSLSLLIFLCLVKINSSFILLCQIQGFSLYIVLIQLGGYIMSKKFSVIFNKISNLSYSIYLFHHHIIQDVQAINNPKKWYLHLMLLGISFLLTFICSHIHLTVVNSILKSKIFMNLESFFI